MKKENRRKFLKYLASIAGTIVAVSVYLRFGRTPLAGMNTTSQALSATTSKSRLPPGQYGVKELEVLHIDGIPSFSPESWNFEVTGLVKKPFVLSWSEFQALPHMEKKTNFHCVTGWSKMDSKWGGVLFKTIYDLAEPMKDAKFATVMCDAEYTTSLPLADLLETDVLFATDLEGKPLEPRHGGPLRLVVPDKYAYKSAKWIRKVKFTKQQELGYWETRSYSNTADPWTQDRYG